MLRLTSTILIIVALFAVVLGAVYVARGALMPYHVDFLGESAMQAIDDNPDLATLTTVFVRLTGTLLFSAGILLVAIIHYGLRKAQRWAWWATFIGMGVVNGATAALTEPIGGFPWVLAIVLLIVFLAAIGLAAREVFKGVPGRSTAGA
ncbi:MAG: hypothetical protein IBX67_01160 [Dehalococcoidia bacterium]|nr:hypothetical protein [Dehalococcoidia bacterium]